MLNIHHYLIMCLYSLDSFPMQLYSFGETVSIPFWTDEWRPDSFCEKIQANLERGLHTLCLLGNID